MIVFDTAKMLHGADQGLPFILVLVAVEPAVLFLDPVGMRSPRSGVDAGLAHDEDARPVGPVGDDPVFVGVLEDASSHCSPCTGTTGCPVVSTGNAWDNRGSYRLPYSAAMAAM